MRLVQHGYCWCQPLESESASMPLLGPLKNSLTVSLMLVLSCAPSSFSTSCWALVMLTMTGDMSFCWQEKKSVFSGDWGQVEGVVKQVDEKSQTNMNARTYTHWDKRTVHFVNMQRVICSLSGQDNKMRSMVQREFRHRGRRLKRRRGTGRRWRKSKMSHTPMLTIQWAQGERIWTQLVATGGQQTHSERHSWTNRHCHLSLEQMCPTCRHMAGMPNSRLESAIKTVDNWQQEIWRPTYLVWLTQPSQEPPQASTAFLVGPLQIADDCGIWWCARESFHGITLILTCHKRWSSRQTETNH